MSQYHAYENWQAGPHKVIVHKASCGACKSGDGVSGQGTDPSHGKWWGPFDTLTKAQHAVKGIIGKLHRCCK